MWVLWQRSPPLQINTGERQIGVCSVVIVPSPLFLLSFLVLLIKCAAGRAIFYRCFDVKLLNLPTPHLHLSCNLKVQTFNEKFYLY